VTKPQCSAMSGQGPQQPYGVGRPQTHQPAGTPLPAPPLPVLCLPCFGSACQWHFSMGGLIFNQLAAQPGWTCRAAMSAGLGMSRPKDPSTTYECACAVRRVKTPRRTAAEPTWCEPRSARLGTAAAWTPGRTANGQWLQRSAQCSAPTNQQQRHPTLCRWSHHGQHLACTCPVTPV